MSTTYRAALYAPALGSSSEEGVVRATSSGLHFQGPTTQLDMPRGFSLRIGGSIGISIFAEHPDLPNTALVMSDLLFLEDSQLNTWPELSRQLAKLRRKKGAFARGLGCLLVGVILFVVSLILLRPHLVAFVANQVPVAWESQLGDLVFEQITSDQAPIEDATTQAALDRFTQTFTQHNTDGRYTFRFHIVINDDLNAFALPGGHVVIHSGSILKAERGEEVLGVLAHELAHVNQRHSIKSMIDSLGFTILIQSVFDQTAIGGIMLDTAAFLKERQFSRDHEREADQVGLQYLAKAKIDPQGMVRFFERIQEVQSQQSTASLDGGLNFLSTHPSTAERIADIKAATESSQMGPFTDVSAPFEALQESLRQYVAAQTPTP